MIGCDKICGVCHDCESLAWALQYVHADASRAERTLWTWDNYSAPLKHAANHGALRVVSDAAKLAEILARSLCSRGLPAHVEVWAGVQVMTWGLSSDYLEVSKYMADARKALTLIMALPLDCGIDAVLLALDAIQ
jgi:hypothetical protein